MRRSQRQDKLRVGAVILAAGRSRRMGKRKLLLPWGSTSILGHLVEVWSSLGAEQLGVVYALDDAALPGELDRIGFPLHDRIENPNPEAGMFSSIQCAARWFGWRSTLTHWALILGDQPHLRRETLRAVLVLASEQPQQVIQPTYAGHRRHPVLLPRTIFLRLQDSKAVNLREFLAQYKVALTPCDDSGLDLDIDRPEDYSRALQLQGQSDP
jgi:molybdenum cofactor cytidylyltransferase